jgi:hypothetical protein
MWFMKAHSQQKGLFFLRLTPLMVLLVVVLLVLLQQPHRLQCCDVISAVPELMVSVAAPVAAAAPPSVL